MSRIRRTDTTTTPQYEYQDYNPVPPNPPKVTVVIANGTRKDGFVKEIVDEPSKGYYRKRADGEVVLNPVSIKRIEYSSVPATWTIGPHVSWGTRVMYGDMGAKEFAGPSGTKFSNYALDVQGAKDLALVEAYAKMNSPDVLLSVMYKEREKTAALFRRPMGASIDHLERMIARRQRLISRGMSFLNATAQAWLELRFGWRPTMYDIAGIAKAALHEKPIAGRLLVARGGKDVSYSDSATRTLNSITSTSRWAIKARVSAGVLYSYRDLSEAEWRARCLGLSLDNVPSHLWEVMPWSFVADYFVKVGMWLRAITPNPDVVVRGNWVSHQQDLDYSTSDISGDIFISNSPPTTYHISGGYYQEKGKILTRTVNQSLTLTPPKAGVPLSFSQIVDIVTLLLGQVQGGLGRFRH